MFYKIQISKWNFGTTASTSPSMRTRHSIWRFVSYFLLSIVYYSLDDENGCLFWPCLQSVWFVRDRVQVTGAHEDLQMAFGQLPGGTKKLSLDWRQKKFVSDTTQVNLRCKWTFKLSMTGHIYTILQVHAVLTLRKILHMSWRARWG